MRFLIFWMQIFLPIGWGVHFYLAVYNRESKNMDIIDNRRLPKGSTLEKEYHYVKEVACMFLNFISDQKLSNYKELRQYKGNLLRMPWQDSKNVIDCGIFCMLHMQTYNGNPIWDCGVTPQNTTKKIHSLRIQYLSRILQSESNNNRMILKYKIKKLYSTGNLH